MGSGATDPLINRDRVYCPARVVRKLARKAPLERSLVQLVRLGQERFSLFISFRERVYCPARVARKVTYLGPFRERFSLVSSFRERVHCPALREWRKRSLLRPL